MSEILFVSIGAILGANIRFKIHHKLGNLNLDKGFLILIINTFSSFSLGLFIAIASQLSSLSYYYQLGLFFSIGLLGSLSTFSTFIADLYDLLIEFKFYRAFKLFIISLTLGILFFSIGFVLGIK